MNDKLGALGEELQMLTLSSSQSHKLTGANLLNLSIYMFAKQGISVIVCFHLVVAVKYLKPMMWVSSISGLGRKISVVLLGSYNCAVLLGD
jgi:hypothetical protein